MDEREIRERANELHNFLADAEGRERRADQRNTALIRAHEAGWKLVAAALAKGLGDIANAIRDHGRR